MDKTVSSIQQLIDSAADLCKKGFNLLMDYTTGKIKEKMDSDKKEGRAEDE